MPHPKSNKREESKPIRILLVEDNPGDIYLLEKTLLLAQNGALVPVGVNFLSLSVEVCAFG